MHTKIKCVYLDLKLTNILYRCDDGKFTVHIGDLGSIYLPSHSTPKLCATVSTFPPSEFNWQGEKVYELLTKDSYPLLAWQMGVLFFQFSPNQTICPYKDSANDICNRHPLQFAHLSHHSQKDRQYIQDWCYTSAKQEVEGMFGKNMSDLLCQDTKKRPNLREMKFLDQITNLDELYFEPRKYETIINERISNCGIS